MKAIGAAIICTLVLTGCVTTNASMLGTATAVRPAVPPQSVALYRTAEQVPSRYEEVALLNSTGDSGFTDEANWRVFIGFYINWFG